MVAKKNPAPETGSVESVAHRCLTGVTGVERVTQGWSTYVYRATTGTGTYYIRFLPEDASFAAEALAHNILRGKGVLVPRVVCFEHREESSGLSVMITEEVPGR